MKVQWEYALTTAALMTCGLAVMAAQSRAGKVDPRVGLKAGIRDAGQAIRNLELVASLGKPAGFFDPQSPLGNPIAPEQPEKPADAAAAPPAPAEPPKPPAFDPKTANRLDFNNTDLAFDGHRLFMGNYHGFNVYDIEESKDPKVLASVVCPGGQGDVSVYKNLLFMSVEQTRGRLDCGMQGHQTAVSAPNAFAASASSTSPT
ncbi:MAG: hypothetical protein QM736_20455 [Vicinamibacterales bacterium]